MTIFNLVSGGVGLLKNLSDQFNRHNDDVRRTTGQPLLSAIVQAHGVPPCSVTVRECQTKQMPRRITVSP